MVYHRGSLNFYAWIMVVRRLLAGVLLIPAADRLMARLTGEPLDVLRGHRELLARHGRHYLTDPTLFLSHNTDGPGNPLSKVYTAGDMRRAFAEFTHVRTHVRSRNLRAYPWGSDLAVDCVRRLGRRWGWHLSYRDEIAIAYDIARHRRARPAADDADACQGRAALRMIVHHQTGDTISLSAGNDAVWDRSVNWRERFLTRPVSQPGPAGNSRGITSSWEDGVPDGPVSGLRPRLAAGRVPFVVAAPASAGLAVRSRGCSAPRTSPGS